jgi:uncharacterized membrane protein
MRTTALPSLFVVLAAGIAALAPEPGGHAAGSAPAIEQLDQFQVVSPAVAEGRPSGAADLIGRLHPALVHFPIAGLVALAVTDFVGLVLRREAWRRAGMVVLIATAVSLVPTVATGLLRASHIEFHAAEHSLLATHRTLNLIVTGLVAVALVLRAARRRHLQGLQRAHRIVYLASVFAATSLVLVAADFGGRMVYGPNCLPF